MIGRECSLNIKKGYRLQWEEAQAGWVILFPEGMIQLNDTAAMILRQFQQPTVVHEAITKLEEICALTPMRKSVANYL